MNTLIEQEAKMAVAKACPAIFFVTSSNEVCWKETGTVVRDREWMQAMHEAAMSLREHQLREFCEWLSIVARWPSVATVPDRIEAFLKLKL